MRLLPKAQTFKAVPLVYEMQIQMISKLLLHRRAASFIQKPFLSCFVEKLVLLGSLGGQTVQS